VSDNDIARVYASSLVEVAQKKDNLSLVEEELEFIYELFSHDADFNNFITNPGVSREKKNGLIKNVFQGRISQETENFLYLLVENDRQVFLSEIYQSFSELMDDINGRLRVVVTSSITLNDTMRTNIVKELQGTYKKEIILEEKVDESILGGIIIKIGDLLIDGSLAKDLKNIRTKLISSTVRSEATYEN
jgi:F-type H+-transporting ATPase subunit delta